MARIKNESILSSVAFLLLLAAIIGGYFTLGHPEFFYCGIIAMAGLLIQIGVYFKNKQRMKMQQSA